ncbi:hypothetical protein [Paenibacillus andongensis]|uniref:hypothetical protein n=1 Tax=Paenibacillus andongensis TaxID=2975482 RepID=UPI0021BB76A3|nr:hypothetical protein [Paenibacillus andongensis]
MDLGIGRGNYLEGFKEIDRQEPDDEPLSEDELRQLKSDAGGKQIQERIAQGLKGLLTIPPTGDIRSVKGYIGCGSEHKGSLRNQS